MATTMPAAPAVDPIGIADAPLRMSYDEFLAWAGEEIRAEWVDGEVIEFMSVKVRHGLVIQFLYDVVWAFVRLHRLGQVFTEPIELLIRDGRSSRLPDLMVVFASHAEWVSSDRITGSADLVIEVMSHDSVSRDRRDKFADYASAGVPEYWIVEGREGRAGFDAYSLHPDGSYVAMPLDAEGRLYSTVLPGFWLDPAWLAIEPLPKLEWVLRRILPDLERLRDEEDQQEQERLDALTADYGAT